MMTKQILFATTLAALALAGGCKKKDKPAEPAPTPTAKEPGTGSAPTPDTAKPAAAPLTSEALATAYLGTWETWNAGDKAKFTALFAPDAVSHHPDQEVAELKGAAAIVEDAFMLRAAFPDAKAAPQLVLVSGRTVVGVLLVTGTNSGPMKMGDHELPASNQKIGMLVFQALTWNDANLITEEWVVVDGNSMAAQLGLSPMPGRPLMETGAAAPTIVVATGSDVEKTNQAATAKGNDDFNQHDLAAMMAGMADNAVESDQSAPADNVGKAKIEEGTKMFLAAFPDGTVTRVTSLAAGDYVVQVSTFTGTNSGDMGPMKKTDKRVTMTIAEINKFESGKITQLWRFFDSNAMVAQLGLAGEAPAPPEPKTN